MTLTLPHAYVQQIVEHARREAPNECCGVIAGKDGVAVKLWQATNAEHSPYRYSIEGKEFLQIMRELEENGCEMLAVYHSHTHTPAYPSPTDRRQVMLSGWDQPFYILVSLAEEPPDVRAYTIRDGAIAEQRLVIAAATPASE